MKAKDLKPGESTTIELDSPFGIEPLSADQKQLKALISRRHPEYEEKLEHWDFLEDTYEGGREWFEDNIFRYIKEGEKEFEDRKERAYRFNHTREVVDLINKYLFRQNLTRNTDDAPDSVKAFWKKATKNGLPMKEFAKQIAKASSIGGRIGIVVDNPTRSAPLSRAEEKAAGVEPYAYILRPEQLLDYAWNEHGELEWVLVLEVQRDDADPLTSSGEEEYVYRLWNKTSWRLFKEIKEGGKKVVREIANGEHKLGVVPVILHDHIISDEPYCASAMIDDIAYLDRAVANYLSNLDAIIQDQTFSQLAMPAQNLLPGEQSTEKVKEMGSKRVFLYDGEGGGKPEYLSPDVKQAQLIVEVIAKIISEIYHTVGMAAERSKTDNVVSADTGSGVSKAYDFERVNALLAAKADSLEVVENKIIELVARWTGDEAQIEKLKRPLVSYPDNFDIRGLYDEFDLAARLMLVSAPDGVRSEQMKMVVDKLFPQLGEAKRKELEKEVEEWPPEQPELVAPGENKPAANAQSNQTRTVTKSADKKPTEPGQGSVK